MAPERPSSLWLEVTVTVAAEVAEAVGEELSRLGARGLTSEDLGPDADPLRALIAYFPVREAVTGFSGPNISRSDTSTADASETCASATCASGTCASATCASGTCASATCASGAASPAAVVGELGAFLSRLPGWGLDPGPARVTTRIIPDTAWTEQWKAFFRPTRVGRRLVVCPPWEPPEDIGPGDVAVVIDPGQAFGTGSHATTRGALELLEEVLAGDVSDRSVGLPGTGVGRVLDLGTGSRVLAVAAAKLGATAVRAVDNDPVAVEAARGNIERNGTGDRVEVVLGDALEALERAAEMATCPGLVLANLTTEMIVAIMPAVARALEAGGFFVSAGVSAGEGEKRVAEAARAAGLDAAGHRTAEGWVSFLFRKGMASSAALNAADREIHPPGRPRLRAVFYTLGCKANLYDTARMMNDLREAGWDVCFSGAHPGDPGQAGNGSDSREGDNPYGRAGGGAAHACPRSGDLYVVNSCAVTARAEGKSRQLARKLKREHPRALVALVGCYPAVGREEAAATSGADFVLGTADRPLLVQALRERGLDPDVRSETDRIIPGAFAGERTRATLKVQDGCEQFCTYCVIPYARGPSRSRPTADVLGEAALLARSGIREVVVTGIHLGAWGLDLGGTGRRECGRANGVAPAGTDRRTGLPLLADLVREIAAIPGLARVRLSSIEPTEITEDLLRLMATNPKVCRHLHIPLQSGSDTVLARMNRRYTAAEYLAVVKRVRAEVPLIGLTTDVMVGFPGETDGEFEATLDTVRRARFSRLHVFRFSRRPGTPAAEMPGQVEEPVKKARAEELTSLGRRLGREFRESLVGMTLEVLVEKTIRDTDSGEPASEPLSPAWPLSPGTGPLAEGFTDNYVRVVFQAAGGTSSVGEATAVTLETVTRDGMTGRSVQGR